MVKGTLTGRMGSTRTLPSSVTHYHWTRCKNFNGPNFGVSTCEQGFRTTTVNYFHSSMCEAVADPGFPSGGGGARQPQPIIWPNFSWKLHENERNWTKRWGFASLAPLLDPPMWRIKNSLFICAPTLLRTSVEVILGRYEAFKNTFVQCRGPFTPSVSVNVASALRWRLWHSSHWP